MIEWIQTVSGRQFYPLRPRIDDIDIEDIAHALSMKVRYMGHAKRFYSIAEHSCLVSYACQDEHRLWGLLHDAAEAYLPDVSRPIKASLTGFAEIEERLMRLIAERFDLPWPEPSEVTRIDSAILGDEKAVLLGPEPAPWNLPYPPLGLKIFCLPQNNAKALFLHYFRKYTSAE